jgi:PAS domain S-box-containing protein
MFSAARQRKNVDAHYTMRKKPEYSKDTLRQRAEKALSEGLFNDSKEFEDIKDYIHELQVYQAELEMQADELRRTQLELETSRDEYWELYNNAPVGYLSINTAGVIIKVNQTFATMMGETIDSLIRKPLSLFIHPTDHSLFFTVCKKALSSEKFRSCELCFNTTPHHTFYGRLDITPTERDILPEPYYRVSVIDITEKKKADQEKIRLEREFLLSQKEDSLRRLAGGIAHNFNNLLTAVLGGIEISQKEKADVMDDSPLSYAYDAALRAAELSKMMLSYLGQTPVKQDALELTETLQKLIDVMGQTIHGPIKLQLYSAAGPMYIKGDKAQIAQILNNLVTNSVEAIGSEEGEIQVRLYQTTVTIKTRHRYDHTNLPKAGVYVCLEVEDSGSGMSQEVLGRALDPFFTTKFTGRGLGLSAVKGIVLSHNGYLHLESKLHEGATIQILFPCDQEFLINGEIDETPPAYHSLKGLTFLYVDDDPIVRTLGRTLLEAAEAEVFEAGGGNEALHVFEEKFRHINCVILDFAMPDIDGIQTLKKLRAISHAIPVLLISGFLETQTEDWFIDEKPNAFLQKPFNRESFFRAIEKVMFCEGTNTQIK